MGSVDTTATLPIIDIAPFLNPESTTDARSTTAKSINHACVEYGFFYLIGHGIPDSTLDQIISLARDFFHLPQEEKDEIKRHDARRPEGGDGARGYQGMGENVTLGRRDMHEAIDFYHEWNEQGEADSKRRPPYETLQGPNLWPEKPAELKQVYLEYIDLVKKVGEALVRAMGQALDLPAPETSTTDRGVTRETEDSEIFVRNCQDSFWVMRMIGYPALPKDEYSTTGLDNIDEFSCGEHSDYGCVTLLHTDTTPGALQVKLKDSAWLTADPIRGAFVVNIGDMIQQWTNGIWQSTRHRVIHRGDGFRVSVPFFYEPDFNAVVKPLEKCVKESGGKEKYAEVKYGDHLMGKLAGNFYGNNR